MRDVGAGGRQHRVLPLGSERRSGSSESRRDALKPCVPGQLWPRQPAMAAPPRRCFHTCCTACWHQDAARRRARAAPTPSRAPPRTPRMGRLAVGQLQGLHPRMHRAAASSTRSCRARRAEQTCGGEARVEPRGRVEVDGRDHVGLRAAPRLLREASLRVAG